MISDDVAAALDDLLRKADTFSVMYRWKPETSLDDSKGWRTALVTASRRYADSAYDSWRLQSYFDTRLIVWRDGMAVECIGGERPDSGLYHSPPAVTA